MIIILRTRELVAYAVAVAIASGAVVSSSSIIANADVRDEKVEKLNSANLLKNSLHRNLEKRLLLGSEGYIDTYGLYSQDKLTSNTVESPSDTPSSNNVEMLSFYFNDNLFHMDNDNKICWYNNTLHKNTLLRMNYSFKFKDVSKTPLDDQGLRLYVAKDGSYTDIDDLDYFDISFSNGDPVITNSAGMEDRFSLLTYPVQSVTYDQASDSITLTGFLYFMPKDLVGSTFSFFYVNYDKGTSPSLSDLVDLGIDMKDDNAVHSITGTIEFRKIDNFSYHAYVFGAVDYESGVGKVQLSLANSKGEVFKNIMLDRIDGTDDYHTIVDMTDFEYDGDLIPTILVYDNVQSVVRYRLPEKALYNPPKSKYNTPSISGETYKSSKNYWYSDDTKGTPNTSSLSFESLLVNHPNLSVEYEKSVFEFVSSSGDKYTISVDKNNLVEVGPNFEDKFISASGDFNNDITNNFSKGVVTDSYGVDYNSILSSLELKLKNPNELFTVNLYTYSTIDSLPYVTEQLDVAKIGLDNVAPYSSVEQESTLNGNIINVIQNDLVDDGSGLKGTVARIYKKDEPSNYKEVTLDTKGNSSVSQSVNLFSLSSQDYLGYSGDIVVDVYSTDKVGNEGLVSTKEFNVSVIEPITEALTSKEAYIGDKSFIKKDYTPGDMVNMNLSTAGSSGVYGIFSYSVDSSKNRKVEYGLCKMELEDGSYQLMSVDLVNGTKSSVYYSSSGEEVYGLPIMANFYKSEMKSDNGEEVTNISIMALPSGATDGMRGLAKREERFKLTFIPTDYLMTVSDANAILPSLQFDSLVYDTVLDSKSPSLLNPPMLVRDGDKIRVKFSLVDRFSGIKEGSLAVGVQTSPTMDNTARLASYLPYFNPNNSMEVPYTIRTLADGSEVADVDFTFTLKDFPNAGVSDYSLLNSLHFISTDNSGNADIAFSINNSMTPFCTFVESRLEIASGYEFYDDSSKTYWVKPGAELEVNSKGYDYNYYSNSTVKRNNVITLTDSNNKSISYTIDTDSKLYEVSDYDSTSEPGITLLEDSISAINNGLKKRVTLDFVYGNQQPYMSYFEFLETSYKLKVSDIDNDDVIKVSHNSSGLYYSSMTGYYNSQYGHFQETDFYINVDAVAPTSSEDQSSSISEDNVLSIVQNGIADSGSGIKKVYAKFKTIDGKLIKSKSNEELVVDLESNNGSDYSFDVDLASLDGGTLLDYIGYMSVEVYAIDKVGNEGLVSSTRVFKAKEKPSLDGVQLIGYDFEDDNTIWVKPSTELTVKFDSYIVNDEDRFIDKSELTVGSETVTLNKDNTVNRDTNSVLTGESLVVSESSLDCVNTSSNELKFNLIDTAKDLNLSLKSFNKYNVSDVYDFAKPISVDSTAPTSTSKSTIDVVKGRLHISQSDIVDDGSGLDESSVSVYIYPKDSSDKGEAMQLDLIDGVFKTDVNLIKHLKGYAGLVSIEIIASDNVGNVGRIGDIEEILVEPESPVSSNVIVNHDGYETQDMIWVKNGNQIDITQNGSSSTSFINNSYINIGTSDSQFDEGLVLSSSITPSGINHSVDGGLFTVIENSINTETIAGAKKTVGKVKLEVSSPSVIDNPLYVWGNSAIELSGLVSEGDWINSIKPVSIDNEIPIEVNPMTLNKVHNNLLELNGLTLTDTKSGLDENSAIIEIYEKYNPTNKVQVTLDKLTDGSYGKTLDLRATGNFTGEVVIDIIASDNLGNTGVVSSYEFVRDADSVLDTNTNLDGFIYSDDTTHWIVAGDNSFHIDSSLVSTNNPLTGATIIITTNKDLALSDDVLSTIVINKDGAQIEQGSDFRVTIGNSSFGSVDNGDSTFNNSLSLDINLGGFADEDEIYVWVSYESDNLNSGFTRYDKPIKTDTVNPEIEGDLVSRDKINVTTSDSGSGVKEVIVNYVDGSSRPFINKTLEITEDVKSVTVVDNVGNSNVLEVGQFVSTINAAIKPQIIQNENGYKSLVITATASVNNRPGNVNVKFNLRGTGEGIAFIDDNGLIASDVNELNHTFTLVDVDKDLTVESIDVVNVARNISRLVVRYVDGSYNNYYFYIESQYDFETGWTKEAEDFESFIVATPEEDEDVPPVEEEPSIPDEGENADNTNPDDDNVDNTTPDVGDEDGDVDEDQPDNGDEDQDNGDEDKPVNGDTGNDQPVDGDTGNVDDGNVNIEEPVNPPVDEPTDNPVDEPTNDSDVEEPTDTDRPTDEPTDNPVDNPTDTDRPTGDPSYPVVEEPNDSDVDNSSDSDVDSEDVENSDTDSNVDSNDNVSNDTGSKNEQSENSNSNKPSTNKGNNVLNSSQNKLPNTGGTDSNVLLNLGYFLTTIGSILFSRKKKNK